MLVFQFMITLKFGGTSMENGERIISSSDIVMSRAQKERCAVVVSAASGVSNALQDAINDCVAGGNVSHHVASLVSRHEKIIAEIESALSAFNAKLVREKIAPFFSEYEKLLTGCASFAECPDTVHCRIMGMGELLSSTIMEEVFRAKNQNVVWLDSRNFIFTTGNQKEGDADYEACKNAARPYRDNGEKNSAQILLFPGFICSWNGGTGKQTLAGLLGRNGSDFSAAIIGASLHSRIVEFWTDVDGIYTADPRVVNDAVLVQDMSYEEAIELAFFGSKVLHPKTLAPLAAKNIEAWSKNSKKPEVRGTRIGRGPFASESEVGDVRGISCLKHIAMISVSGIGMRGRTGTASRIFEAVSQARISVLLITQSSSEYTISFCIRDFEADSALDALRNEFDLELKSGIINQIETNKNASIVSIVGDNMIQKTGVASRFFASLASQDINILAIAQGSSERCISCVVKDEASDTAVRAAHRFFFNTSQTIEVFLFGAGTIGGALLEQIAAQKQKLLSANIDVRVMSIATIDKMVIDKNGIDVHEWKKIVEQSNVAPNVDEVISFVKKEKPLNPVFVDCTASYDLPEKYVDLFRAGFSIVTPNKRANSLSLSYYHELRKTANAMRRRFLYEANVGAGLPIIDTLQNLFKSGDKLTGFTGIMSGSLSYIFGRLDDDVSFSQAVKEAKELRFTEPDPRDDLNGMDVARKALIIAREAGRKIELADIKINKVFPDDFDTSGSIEEFMKNLSKVDLYFHEKIASLKKHGKALRMGAIISENEYSVGMFEVDANDVLYNVKGGENAFVFHTERYNPIPLTVRGYGAGAGVTAAGVFGDILRTVSFNPD